MQDNDLLFFDIEADNLLLDATNIWCIVGYYNNRYHIYFEPDESFMGRHTSKKFRL
jgi:hypothetical protein